MAARASLVALLLTAAACGTAPAGSPWLAPDAIDDVSWGAICGPRTRHTVQPDSAASPGIVARRTYRWASDRGLVDCELSRDKRTGRLMQLEVRVAWLEDLGETVTGAEPTIDRLRSLLLEEIRPELQPLVRTLSFAPHLLYGVPLISPYRVEGGYDRTYAFWVLNVFYAEVAR